MVAQETGSTRQAVQQTGEGSPRRLSIGFELILFLSLTEFKLFLLTCFFSRKWVILSLLFLASTTWPRVPLFMLLSPSESQVRLLFSWDLAALLSVKEKQCGCSHCWQTQRLHLHLLNTQLISIQTRCNTQALPTYTGLCVYQVSLSWCFILLLLFVFDRVSLHCPGWSQTSRVKPPSCLSLWLS